MKRLSPPREPQGLPSGGWVGVDPGGDGTIGYVWGVGQCEFWRFDQMTDQETWDVFRVLAGKAVAGALEKVGAMGFAVRGRRQGIASTFKFGRNAGLVEGFLVASRMRWDWVMPAKWMGDLRCRTGGDKRVTRSAAQKLWPDLRWTMKNSEGALIAEWCRVHSSWGRTQTRGVDTAQPDLEAMRLISA